jgi:hypothetical protein
MPGKMARPDPRPNARFTEVLVAVSTSRLSCKRAGKTRTLMPVWDSSGESRFTILLDFEPVSPERALCPYERLNYRRVASF